MGVEEILVHLGGPSSMKDDSRLRAMAAAYKEFQPETKISLTDQLSSFQDYAQARSHPDWFSSSSEQQSDVRDESGSIAVLRTGEPPTRASAVCDRPRGSFESLDYVEDTPLAIEALESQLLTSSLVVSQPNSSPLAQRPAKKQRLYSGCATEDQSCNATASDEDVVGKNFGEPRDEQYTLSLLMDNPSRSIYSSQIPSASPGLKTSPTPREKAESMADRATGNKTPPPDFSSMPDEIMAPTPPTSVQAAPTTWITTALAQLADTLNMPVRYKPEFTNRELRRSERGYWRIDPSTWTVVLQAEFWEYLQELIGSGQAGWGVSAYREVKWPSRDSETEASKPEKNDGAEDNLQVEGDPSLGIIRIFCWGEVVGHVYLLAFVASKSRVKHVRAQWFDADGEVIVQMP